MSDRDGLFRQDLEWGWMNWAAFGCLYWLGYGTVETLLLTLLPFSALEEARIASSHPLAAATFVALYGLLGLAAGALVSTLPVALRMPAVLASLPGLWAANLVLHWYWDSLIYLPALVALVGVSMLIVMDVRRGLGTRTPLRTGVGISAPLVGVVALSDALGVESVAVRIVAVALAVAAARMLCFRGDESRTPPRYFVRRAAVAFGGLVIAAYASSLLQPPVPLDENEPSALVEGVSPNAERPHVVLVTWDTVRAESVSLYGFEASTSPHLEELAAEATVFRRAYAPSNMTLSSHASLFTGLYPTAHGAHYHQPDFPNGAPLAEGAQTLAETLNSLGYATYAIAANNAYVTADFGLAQGFAHFDSRAPVVPLGEMHKIYLRRLFRDLLVTAWARLPLVPRSSFDRLYRTADEIHAASIGALDRAEETSRPFFLFVNFMDAHDPYIPPAPYDSLVEGFDSSFRSERFHSLAMNVLMHREPIDPRDREHLESQYAGGIAYLDSVLGKLVEELKERGLYEDTLLIITSDHGEVFGDDLLFGHAVSLLRDQIHVPLVVKYPGQEAPEDVHSVVSLVDVMPTVLKAVDGDVPSGLHGRPLQQALPNRDVFAEHFRPGHRLWAGDWLGDSQTAILVGDRKLIVHHEDGRTELLRLEIDGRETQLEDRTEESAMRERLELWRQALSAAKVGGGAVDEETLRRLKALGYV